MTEKSTSLTEDSVNEPADANTLTNHSEKEGANHSTKAVKSKREIMEELSRERFPWEE